MKKLLIGAAALLALVACGQESPEPATQEEPALVSGIDTSGMNKSVRPGDDFFTYVNGTWVAETEMPADKPTYGAFYILHEKSQEAVKAIIERSADGDFARGSDEQKVGDLYNSFLDWDTRNAKGMEPLQPELDRIDAIETHDDLVAYWANAVRRGLDAPLTAGQTEDLLDPSQYIYVLSQSGLGLPDREYYFKDDPASEEIRQKYVDHVEKMLGLAGFAGAAEAAKTIMALETQLAAEHMTKEKARDYAGNYKRHPLSELPDIMPTFNWDGYLAELGLQELPEIALFYHDYMKALDGIIQDTAIDTWKTYLRWSALNGNAARLTGDLDAQNFEFYGKVLSGTEEQQPDWRRAVSVVDGDLGEVVGKVYVKEHFPPEAKERMLELVGNLVKAYEKSITELDWMGEETKAQALDKLSKFTPMIGYPDKWREYDFDIAADDYFGNRQRAASAEYDRQLERQGGPVDRSEWFLNPQTVNAYYNPPLNQIVFPAAILQPPFFDLEADDAVNYGAIGAVIGHEIGHGFDDKGSTFDGDGVLRNWWTDEDRAEFEKRTAALIAQYNEFKPFEDLAVNGEYTQGENIGDLGGVTIGLLAYKLSLEDKEPPVIDGFTGIQRVFLGYGQVWRSIARDEYVRQQVATDPHSPAVYRVNGPVRNVPEWYEAFEIAETDALYLPPEERVKIW